MGDYVFSVNLSSDYAVKRCVANVTNHNQKTVYRKEHSEILD